MTEFPCAGPGEEESDAALFDEAMDLIQQRWQSLNFIDDDDVILGRDFFSQALGTVAEGEIQGRIQEIVDTGTCEALADEEAFPRLARAEQEVRLLCQEAL
jgi:hypothetical protein